MSATLKSTLGDMVRDALKRYLQDFEAMDHDVLGQSPGGAARSCYDFTFETAVVNMRIAKRIRGEDPGPFPFEGWASAPPELCDKAKQSAALTDATNEVLAAWDQLDEARLSDKITLPSGETSPVEMMSLCSVHMNYHDAQLNLIQAIHGDAEMHWH